MPGSRNKLSKKHILSPTVTNSTRNHFGSQLALGSVHGKFQRHVWQPLEWVPQPCSIWCASENAGLRPRNGAVPGGRFVQPGLVLFVGNDSAVFSTLKCVEQTQHISYNLF